MTDIAQKLWGFCHTLRHDGVDCGDYIEQITYLLFVVSERFPYLGYFVLPPASPAMANLSASAKLAKWKIIQDHGIDHDTAG